MDSRNVDARLEAPPLFRRLAYAAVMDLADDTLVVGAAADLLAVRDMAGKRGAILVRLGEPTIAERLKKLLLLWQVGATSVVVVGPREELDALKKAAKPPIPRGKLHWHGVTDEGERWDDEAKGPLAEHLDAALAPDRAFDWDGYEERFRRSAERNTQQRAFAQRLHGQTPIVTYALLTLNLAMFGLQAALGGIDPSVRLLIRLGGVAPDLVLEGEVWRLVSGAFLHGGVMHLAFNMMVLVILGRFVERLLGPARFLVLYAACAIAGALASTFLMDAPVSVGASGALWGILAAEAVFAFAPGFLPPPMVPLARRTAIINLGLNVFASFRPHIDWAAHAGGGIVGALLLYFVLSRGVPRGERIASAAPTSSRALNGLAAVCAAVLLGGVVLGPTLGGALEPVPTAPVLQRVAIEGAGVSVEIPRDLAPQAAEADGTGRVGQGFGEIFQDPAMVDVAIIPLSPPVPDEALPGELAAITETLSEAPEHATIQTGPTALVDTPLRAAATVSYRYESGVRHDTAIGLTDDHIVRVDVLYWPDADLYAARLARRVAESVR